VQELAAQVAEALVKLRHLPARPPVADGSALLSRLLSLQIRHAWHLMEHESRTGKAHRGVDFGISGRIPIPFHDEITKLGQSSRMVASCAVLATEDLRTQNMSRSARGTQDKPGRMVRQKAGLNREILSAGLGMAHNMLAYKAVEAGTRLHVSDRRQLKPIAALRRVLGDRAQNAHATCA
jgi:hypothetical protein